MNEYTQPNSILLIKLKLLNHECITKYMNKPYDDNMIKVYYLCVQDMIKKFNPDFTHIGYNQITIGYYNNNPTDKNIYYENNVLTSSLFSSYCSIKFNFHIENLLKNNKTYNKELFDLLSRHEQIFISEIYYTNNDIDKTSQLTQIENDCENKYLDEYAKKYLGHSYSINSLSVSEIKNMLRFVGIDWSNDIPNYIYKGIYC